MLDFGEVALAARPGELGAGVRAPRDGRRTIPASGCWRRRVAERRARGDELCDACRWSLERLLRAAERAGLTLALPVGGDALAGRRARARRALLADAFAGAPLGLVWDPGRLSVLAALGLAISDDRLRALAGAAVLAIENDAVGLEAGYLPGLGERDAARRGARAAGRGSPHRHRRPDATDAEVAAAAARVATEQSKIREIRVAGADAAATFFLRSAGAVC